MLKNTRGGEKFVQSAKEMQLTATPTHNNYFCLAARQCHAARLGPCARSRQASDLGLLGNPRYASAPTPIDSIVVIRAAIAALAHAPVQVVMTTGYQDVPEEFGTLPSNFHHAAYLPGRAMAERCDLMVHHGGHSSVKTGLSAGTPAVIIPTITERESNARRLAALGAGEIVLPVDSADHEKHIDVAEFSAKVHRVLNDAGYLSCARRVAESMRKFGGAQEAAERIERFAGVRN
jgi:UDP:flavonoid glycosyltransferase YjiC (YdhE family)